MLGRWQGGIATVLTVVATVTLVVLDLTDEVVRRWWAAHAFTTATVAGLLVLAITVLVVNQVLSFRQVRDRSQATAAHAAIVLGQAARAAKAASAARDGSGDRDAARDAASEEARTYMSVLLTAAPVLIDAPVPRYFLEQAQHFGGDLARRLAARADASAGIAVPAGSLDEALDRLRAASTPLLQVLNPAQRAAAGASGDVTDPERPAQ